MKEKVALVIFGATGDLAQRKLFPALYHLYVSGNLPTDLSIVALSRRHWDDNEFRLYVRDSFVKHATDEVYQKLDQFLESVIYVEGVFDDDQSYERVVDRLNEINSSSTLSRVYYYLSISPQYYPSVIEGIGKRLNAVHGEQILMIEKPFGTDEKSAQELNALARTYFSDQHIYRIDHYLLKRGLRWILDIRHANSHLNQVWNTSGIEEIAVSFIEHNLVGKRGGVYNALGALRDVGQNHLLFSLATVLVNPENHDAEAEERNRVISNLSLWSNDPAKDIVRAQYREYTDEVEIPDSTTETYFEVTARINVPEWNGVKVVLKAGKGFASSHSCLEVVFKETAGGGTLTVPFHNVREFKKPDWLKLDREMIREGHFSEDGYEGVFLAALHQDQTHFATIDEILSSWRFIDMVRTRWAAVPLLSYPKGSSNLPQ